MNTDDNKIISGIASLGGLWEILQWQMVAHKGMWWGPKVLTDSVFFFNQKKFYCAIRSKTRYITTKLIRKGRQFLYPKIMHNASQGTKTMTQHEVQWHFFKRKENGSVPSGQGLTRQPNTAKPRAKQWTRSPISYLLLGKLPPMIRRCIQRLNLPVSKYNSRACICALPRSQSWLST